MRTSAAPHRTRARLLALAAALFVALPVGVLAASPAEASPYYRVPTTVVAKKNSCTLTWYRDKWDGPVKTYRVWVVPQFAGPPVTRGTVAGAGGTYRTITVKPQTPGRLGGTTVGGLLRGKSYTFWLEAIYPSIWYGHNLSFQVATTRACLPR
jgi:hypothetical protein